MKTEKNKINFNIANYLVTSAETFPTKCAIIEILNKKKHKEVTFFQLNLLSNQYANAFKRKGIKEKHKVLLLINFSTHFIAIIFALFKIGAIPILIDSGTGMMQFLKNIKNVKPDVLIGNFKANILSFLFYKYFYPIKIKIFNSKLILRIENIFSKNYANKFPIAETKKNTTAALLFTSGTTDTPKAVTYTHGMIEEQVSLLNDKYRFLSEEVDLSTLPVFSLFDIAMHMTTIIPNINMAKPSSLNPKNIVQAITKYNVTTTYGSPQMIEKIIDYALEKKVQLLKLKRVLIYGSNISYRLIIKICDNFPHINGITTYGATEALPLSSISLNEIKDETLKETFEGKGICIGYPFKGVKIKTIEISENIIENIQDLKYIDENDPGEIIVQGDAVTKEYYKDEFFTKYSKINDGDASWHRTGDIGYIDNKKRLWYLGRKHDIVIYKNKKMFTIPYETLYDTYFKIHKSALVGIGDKPNQIPVMIIEPYKKYFPKNNKENNDFLNELNIFKKKYNILNEINHILFHPKLPLDTRHNSKILRKELLTFAKEKIS